MKTKRYWIPLAALLAIALVLTSCSGASNYSRESDYAEAPSSYEEGYSYESEGGDNSGKVYTNESAVKERMLVYDVNYSLESTEYEKARQTLEDKAVELGGYISTFNSHSGSSESVSYLFRIPTKNLTAFTDVIEAQGNVTRKNTSVKDYTNVYYDYETEIELLKTEEEYVKLYLDEATDSYERTNLIDQLLSIRREIARMEREKNNITEVVMYSSVTVDLYNVASYTDITVDYGDSLREAFVSGWEGFANVMKGLLYVIILLSPVIVILLVVAVIVVVIVLIATRGKRKNRKNPPAPPKAPVGAVPANPAQFPEKKQ
ncbi:MAG: DUF4349 domain-containing protein [Clostridia bacterium]|nr:DUF4349 domain-containing protein [Clostridia bacterium]